jgi:cell division protein ZapE
MTDFLERFREAVNSGRLKPDASQEAAADKLADLARRIAVWPSGPFGLLRSPPRGLYLWGNVGRGKSMLMDMFFDTAAGVTKRRVHFNAFMADIHRRLHEARRHARDPIVSVGAVLARHARLLCFDEFQVGDVADAMILGRLFEQLFARGCIVVATSNTAPERLYEGGLNRALFLPFIDLIRERMDIVCINGAVDYRMGHAGEGYHTGPGAAAAMDEVWRALAKDGEHATALTVLGRQLPVAHAAGRAARFSFDELCARPLAGADYLAIAEAFDTVLIDAIPVLDPARRDEARRFTLLIDTLYDARVRLVCSAAVPPEALYPAGTAAEAFRRTVSRLLEMRSTAYTSRARR